MIDGTLSPEPARSKPFDTSSFNTINYIDKVSIPSLLLPLQLTIRSMTLVFIISTLLSSPKRRADRTALEIAAQVALTVWKQRIDAALGCDARDIERWNIVKHGNRKDHHQHATMRAYITGRPVATIHLRMTKQFIATGIKVWANGVPMTTQGMDLVGEVY
ncbi:hypothetical protein EYR36_010685 [Pleurotus pulmonarius]|nr:hypothetical protein EYR36_010685 [Pleurotus pulmonarius]KAF4590590.1 hypothetical protein EYR38_009892 [Pleurotus pulmonarius]